MNVGKKNTESFYFLGCFLEVIIRLWGFGFFKKIWAIFPMIKSFVWCQNHIFSGQNLAKKSHVKETSVFFLGEFLYHGKSKKGLANGIEQFGPLD